MKRILNSILSLALCFSSVACSQQNLSDGLIAHYPFNSNARDESGKEHNGTLINVTPTTDRFGNANSAYRFNGANSKITTTWSGLTGTQPRTVSMWVKKNPASYSSSNHVMELYDAGGPTVNGSNLAYTVHQDKSFSVIINTYGGWARYKSIHVDTLWHHYVWVLPKLPSPHISDFKIYQDAILLTDIESLQDQPINLLSGNPVGFGQYVSCYGSVDDVRIYNRAVSESEIQELFHEGGWSGKLSDNKSDGLYATIAKFLSAGTNGTYVQLIDGYLTDRSTRTDLGTGNVFKKINETTFLLPSPPAGYSSLRQTLSFQITQSFGERPDFVEILYYRNPQYAVHLENGVVVIPMAPTDRQEYFSYSSKGIDPQSEIGQICLWTNGMQKFAMSGQNLRQQHFCSIIDIAGVVAQERYAREEEYYSGRLPIESDIDPDIIPLAVGD
jgi:hypothetical protein